MIGNISTETACAVTGAPFERVSQYLKRGQLSLVLDSPHSTKREWVVLDVVKLAVLVDLTGIVPVGLASTFINREGGGMDAAWHDLGCNSAIMEPNTPQWFLVVTRRHHSEEPAITAVNRPAVAQSIVFGANEPNPPFVSIVLNLTEIARNVRRKLEAIGGC